MGPTARSRRVGRGSGRTRSSPRGVCLSKFTTRGPSLGVRFRRVSLRQSANSVRASERQFVRLCQSANFVSAMLAQGRHYHRAVLARAQVSSVRCLRRGAITAERCLRQSASEDAVSLRRQLRQSAICVHWVFVPSHVPWVSSGCAEYQGERGRAGERGGRSSRTGTTVGAVRESCGPTSTDPYQNSIRCPTLRRAIVHTTAVCLWIGATALAATGCFCVSGLRRP